MLHNSSEKLIQLCLYQAVRRHHNTVDTNLDSLRRGDS